MLRNDESIAPYQTRTRAARLLAPLLTLTCLLSACGEKSMAKVTNESAAIEMITRLTEYDLDAGKEEVGEGPTTRWNVYVKEGWLGDGEAGRATTVLSYYGLPRPEDLTASAMESGMGFPDPEAARARLGRDIETKIEKQLRLLPGVARVKASVVLPDNDDIKVKPYKASASISIVRKEEKPGFTIEQVQNQVAPSVPDLQPQNVSVTMSYQPPPVIPRHDLNMRRRNRAMLYVGIALVSVLCALLTMLLLKTRRQRAELAMLRDSDDEALELKDDSDPTQLPDGEVEQRQLDDANSDGVGARARQLPADGMSTNN